MQSWPFLKSFGFFRNWSLTVEEDDLIEVRKAGLKVRLRD